MNCRVEHPIGPPVSPAVIHDTLERVLLEKQAAPIEVIDLPRTVGMLGERPVEVELDDLRDLYTESGQTLEGSFSAVSTATIARVGAFFQIFRDLQDYHPFAPL